MDSGTSLTPKTLNIKGKVFTFYEPKVMGILNVTPDSFFDGGKYSNEEEISSRIHQMVAEGVDIIDVGGQSTRPGATYVDEEEELFRVIPVIMSIKKLYPEMLVSIDTFRSNVAQTAVKYGADLVNDVSSGRMDEKMLPLVASLSVPYIAMHSRGTSETMTKLSDYQDITLEIVQFFAHKIRELQQLGVHDIVIDPGFGFAKNVDQNYELLKNIEYLQVLKKPVMVGISRKSMVYKSLGISPEAALNGTSILNTYAILKGADILRVHDVLEAKQAIKLCKKLL